MFSVARTTLECPVVVKMGVKMGTVLGINKAMKRLKDVRRGILEG